MTDTKKNFKQMIVELNQTGRSVRGLAKNMAYLKQRFTNGKFIFANQSTGLTGKRSS